MVDTDSAPGLRVIRAWVRLDAAFAELNRQLRHEYGITGAQLAVLRIVAEQDGVTLAALRRQLSMHPATIGQLVDRLARGQLVELEPDLSDRRLRRVLLTRTGQELLAAAPLAGPVRLRATAADSRRLDALADALTDALDLFGLTPWAA